MKQKPEFRYRWARKCRLNYYMHAEKIRSRRVMMYGMIWNSIPRADLPVVNIPVTVPFKTNACKTICNNGSERLAGLTDSEE